MALKPVVNMAEGHGAPGTRAEDEGGVHFSRHKTISPNRASGFDDTRRRGYNRGVVFVEKSVDNETEVSYESD